MTQLENLKAYFHHIFKLFLRILLIGPLLHFMNVGVKPLTDFAILDAYYLANREYRGEANILNDGRQT